MLFLYPAVRPRNIQTKRLENPQVGLRVRRPRQKPFLSLSLAVFIHCVSYAFHISHTYTRSAHSLTDSHSKNCHFPALRPGSFMFARILPHISLSFSLTLSLSLARKNSSFGIALSRHPTLLHTFQGPKQLFGAGPWPRANILLSRTHSTARQAFRFLAPDPARAALCGRDNVLTPARALSLLASVNYF